MKILWAICLSGLLLACDGASGDKRKQSKLLPKPTDGSHIVEAREGELYFDSTLLPVGEPLDRWIEILGAPDTEPSGMVKWFKHGLVVLTQGNVCGKQWVLTAQVWYTVEPSDDDGTVPIFNGRTVLEGTEIDPNKTYKSRWLKIGKGKHGCRAVRSEPFENSFGHCNAEKLGFSITLTPKKKVRVVYVRPKRRQYDALIAQKGLSPARRWYKIAKEQGWCEDDPYNPKVIPKREVE